MDVITVEDNREKVPEDIGRFSSHPREPHVLVDDMAGSSSTSSRDKGAVHRISERVHSIDNLRTFLVGVLVLQHAVLETISRIPGDVEALYPKQYIFLDMFVGIGRQVVIGMLFFVSGYASSLSLAGNSRTPQRFILRKIRRLAILSITGCLTAGIITYIFGPWETAVEGQTSYYAQMIGKVYLLHAPILYLLLLFVFDAIYAVSPAFDLQKTANYFTSERQYNLSKYVIMFIIEIWTICVGAGYIFGAAPPFLSPLVKFIHPAPQDFIQYAIGYIAGVYLSSYSKFLIAEHSTNIAPMILRLITRVWVSSTILFSLRRRYPDLILYFGSLKTAPTSSIPRGSFSLRDEDLFIAFYGLWTAITFVLLSTPIIQIFLANNRLNRDWGVVSRATAAQPFIHMVFVFLISKFATCIGNLIVRCAVVGVGAVLCGWGAASFGILVWQVLDGH